MELILAVCLVLILGGWIGFLKKRVSDLTDQVAVLETEREARAPRGKRPDLGEEKTTAGIATYTLE